MSLNLTLARNASGGEFTVTVETSGGTTFTGNAATLERVSSSNRCRTLADTQYSLARNGAALRNGNVALINRGLPVCGNTLVKVTFSDPTDASRYNGDYNLIIDPSY